MTAQLTIVTLSIVWIWIVLSKALSAFRAEAAELEREAEERRRNVRW